jgi:hypothetical protein
MLITWVGRAQTLKEEGTKEMTEANYDQSQSDSVSNPALLP